MTNTTASVSLRRLSLPVWFLLVASILFGAFQVFVSLHKLNNLQAGMMDLGDFRQEMFQISHGNWWAYGTVFQTPAVAQDGFFLLYPLAYAYRFLGGVSLLFIVQAAGTAVTAWGIYRAARLHKLSPWAASVVGTVFLFYPAVIGGSQFDYELSRHLTPMGLRWGFRGRPHSFLAP